MYAKAARETLKNRFNKWVLYTTGVVSIFEIYYKQLGTWLVYNYDKM